jgi:hypothetical protein
MPCCSISLLSIQEIKKVLKAIYSRIVPVKTAECFQLCEGLLSNGIGLEVGGPSSVFEKNGILPIYSIIENLDNCNFADTTTWQETVTEGMTFQFSKSHALGRQYICEATNLHKIPSCKYDFLLSSHVIEHSANPLQALSEWMRILKDEGVLILLIPHKDGTFDHRRPVTTLEHLIKDFENETKEDDKTHLPEILELHDLTKDLGAGTFEAFKKRSEHNFQNRCLHQHVFDTGIAIGMIDYKKLQIHAVEAILPCHIVIVAQKRTGEAIDNQIFINATAEHRLQSPFDSDRIPSIV